MYQTVFRINLMLRSLDALYNNTTVPVGQSPPKLTLRTLFLAITPERAGTGKKLLLVQFQAHNAPQNWPGCNVLHSLDRRLTNPQID